MKQSSQKHEKFKDVLSKELNDYLQAEYQKYPEEDLLKVDLHCHDHNSDQPDELMGRILKVPETWLKTEDLFKVLDKNGCDVYCVTNHNNARSCYDTQDRGVDVLNAAEFTCTIPEYNIFIHVLTYGFTPSQERQLNKLRGNLYRFLSYCKNHNIPTIWAHPLYNYYAKKMPDLEFFYKISLLFERFELLNGQRETWQNLLVKNWIETLTPEKIDLLAEEFNIDVHQYCRDPYRKSFSGGSDSHMGIFSGLTGSYLYVPNLKDKLKYHLPSDLALEAIRQGNMIPYGTYTKHEKLNIAFLEYFCQVALNYKDPGLTRLLLHKGSSKQKLLAFVLSNVISELRHHKTTIKFIELFHKGVQGSSPGKLRKYLAPKEYKEIFSDLIELSKLHKGGTETLGEDYQAVLHNMYKNLNGIFLERLKVKYEKALKDNKHIDLDTLFQFIDLPSTFRNVIDQPEKSNSSKLDLIGTLNDLSFPFLSSSILLAANFTSAKVLFNHRELLNNFSNHLGKLRHPKRMLWLTDTYEDKNGVSVVLKAMHEAIKEYDLPIDLLVCSDTVKEDDHLLVIKPTVELPNPIYPEQIIRMPDYMEIHALFDSNEYDRIMCSTEGPMGMAAIYLKNAFSVPTHFYMHTDWLTFAKNGLKLHRENLSRVKRALRSYYKMFDHMFVLNSEHQAWVTSPSIGFNKDQVSITRHWVDDYFKPNLGARKRSLWLGEEVKIMLYVGRISKEKGVMEIPKIYHAVKKKVPHLKLVIVGTGPAKDDLKKEIPNTIFHDWLDRRELPDIYSSADLLVFPSKFDTFSCVVLEAMSCGLPVLAYDTKGPRDIIKHGVNGLLGNTKSDLMKLALGYFQDPNSHEVYKRNAVQQAKRFNKKEILNQLLEDVGFESIKEESFETVKGV